MQWTLRGAHLLLQTRTKVLNNELEDVFRGWLPAVPATGRLTPDFLTHSVLSPNDSETITVSR
jgi:hypothetical protein